MHIPGQKQRLLIVYPGPTSRFLPSVQPGTHVEPKGVVTFQDKPSNLITLRVIRIGGSTTDELLRWACRMSIHFESKMRDRYWTSAKIVCLTEIIFMRDMCCGCLERLLRFSRCWLLNQFCTFGWELKVGRNAGTGIHRLLANPIRC